MYQTFLSVRSWLELIKEKVRFLLRMIHNPNVIQALSFFSGSAGRTCVWDAGSCWDWNHRSPDDRWRSLQRKGGLP